MHFIYVSIQVLTLVLVYPPSFLVAAAVPMHPTKPQSMRKGCHEKNRQAPLGRVPAKYPTPTAYAKKLTTNKL